jgi:hypothetical protein
MEEQKLVPPTRDDIREAMAGRGASVTLEPCVGGFYTFWTNQRTVGRTFYPRKNDIHEAASIDREIARRAAGERDFKRENAPGVPQ